MLNRILDAMRIGDLGGDADFTPDVAIGTQLGLSDRRAGVTRSGVALPAASRPETCNCDSSALRTADGIPLALRVTGGDGIWPSLAGV